MDQEPLVTEQVEAGRQFLDEFEKLANVPIAFWLKETEVGRWYLYIASEQVVSRGTLAAYAQVTQAARGFNDPNFDPFRIKLIPVEHEYAQAALALLQRYPGKFPTRIPGRVFGVLGVDDAYVYAPAVPVP
jgi:hypothetical protein